jgi:hypothetical protein
MIFMSKKNKRGLDIRVVESLERFAKKSAKIPWILKIPFGLVLIVLGSVMLVIPGPGLFTLLCGLVLVSPNAATFVIKTSERYIGWRAKKK